MPSYMPIIQLAIWAIAAILAIIASYKKSEEAPYPYTKKGKRLINAAKIAFVLGAIPVVISAIIEIL